MFVERQSFWVIYFISVCIDVQVHWRFAFTNILSVWTKTDVTAVAVDIVSDFID